jgi:DNA-directed RNA polymerase III subunit RPC1
MLSFFLSFFLIILRNIFYDRASFTQICSHFSADGTIKFELPSPAILKPVQLFTGKQIISMLIKHSSKDPSMVNLEKKTKNYDKKANLEELDIPEGILYS